MKKQVFNPASPGFLYTITVLVLTAFAAAGAEIPNPEDVAAGITTTLDTSGFFAVVGVLVSSVIFPVWNAWQKKALNFAGIINSSTTWVSAFVAMFAGLALVGLHFPPGTAEQLATLIFAKDWGALASMFVTVILPTIIRFVKAMNAPTQS